MTLDPWAARQRASSIDRWEASGRCLQFVNWAFGEPGSRMTSNGRGTTPDGNWQDAKEGWYGSLHQHPGDGTDAPAGVPIYWETGPSGNTAGHIVLSDGDGWCYTTDYAGPRSVSRQSIAYLNRLRGTALGWTDDFGGNAIAGITNTASLDTQSFGGFLMALTDEQQSNIYTWLQGLAYGHFPKAEGYSFGIPQALINNQNSTLDAVRAISRADVDEAKLGAAIALSLKPILTALIGELDGSTLSPSEIADELAKRLAA